MAVLKSTPAALVTLVNHACAQNQSTNTFTNSQSLVNIMHRLVDDEHDFYIPLLREFIHSIKAPTYVTDLLKPEDDYQQNDKHIDQLPCEFLKIRLRLLNTILELSEECFNKVVKPTIQGYSSIHDLLFYQAEHDRSVLRNVYDTLSKSAQPDK